MRASTLSANTALVAARPRAMNARVVEPVATSPQRARRVVASSMGIGFDTNEPASDLILPESKLVSPKYGLTGQQMHALGLTKEAMTKTEPI